MSLILNLNLSSILIIVSPATYYNTIKRKRNIIPQSVDKDQPLFFYEEVLYNYIDEIKLYFNRLKSFTISFFYVKNDIIKMVKIKELMIL
jgi:hypothetical protein